jgi:amicyanin
MLRVILVLIVLSALAVAAVVALTRQSASEAEPQPAPAVSPIAAESSPDNSSPAQSSAIDIRNFAYSPAALTIKKGETVTWTNQDTVRHDVRVTSGPVTFTSALLGKGESFSHTFDQVGTYEYICSPHPYMKGTVTVTD